jgi:hypothetical protein
LIGNSLPGVKDRLLNLLQLSQHKSTLAYASVKQKSLELDPISFESVIDLQGNKRFVKYLAVPAFVIALILIINQKIITDSTNRILHYSEKFSPTAPFNFIVENENLRAFYNEDYTLNVRLEGNAIPENVYVENGQQRIKLANSGNSTFSYTFENVQSAMQFQLEAAGFYSQRFDLAVVNRPELTGFELELNFPRYIARKTEMFKNAGNLEIPEGTTVNWRLSTVNADGASISFSSNDFNS